MLLWYIFKGLGYRANQDNKLKRHVSIENQKMPRRRTRHSHVLAGGHLAEQPLRLGQGHYNVVLRIRELRAQCKRPLAVASRVERCTLDA